MFVVKTQILKTMALILKMVVLHLVMHTGR